MHSNGQHQPAGKGFGFARCIAAIEDMCNNATYTAFLAGLEPETRTIVLAPPDPDTWVPIQHWMSFIDCAHRLAFGGDDDKLSEMSEVGMMPEMQRIQSRALRFTSPQFLLTRAAKLWEAYCRNNGHVETSGATANTCEIHYVNVASARIRGFLPFQRGVTHALLKMCGKQRYSVRCLPVTDVARQTLAADWQD